MSISEVEESLDIYFERRADEELQQEGRVRDGNYYKCPSCSGINVIFQGRCIVCTDCGWSTCVI